MSEKWRQTLLGSDAEAAVAEFIRTKGVTRCPTACVLPTQGSVAMADREALEEHERRRAELRRSRYDAQAQQFWNTERSRPAWR